MNRPAFRRTFFLAAILAASTAFAGAEVNKCVDGDGRITLTDAPCPAGARTDVLASAPVVLAQAQLRHDTRAGKPVPGRRFAVDVATLKAARLSMREFDNTAASMRSGRLAGLN